MRGGGGWGSGGGGRERRRRRREIFSRRGLKLGRGGGGAWFLWFSFLGGVGLGKGWVQGCGMGSLNENTS